MDLFTFVRTLATTVYGKVGSEMVRMTLAVGTIDGAPAVGWVRTDSKAFVRRLPSVYRTSGSVVNTLGSLGEAVDVASFPYALLTDHEWKPEYTLHGMTKHSTQGIALKANYKALKATYEKIAA